MTEFQRHAEEATASIAGDAGLQLNFETAPCKADSMIGQSAGDVYLKARFRHGNVDYEIFLYNDEAGVFVNRVWHAFERIDWKEEAKLISGLCAFLKRSLMAPSKDEQAS